MSRTTVRPWPCARPRPRPRPRPRQRQRQHGATTLLLVLALVLLATLASAWSSRAVLMNQLTSQTREQAQQARNAAQAALASAQADVLQAFASAAPQALFAQSATTACPADIAHPNWQCTRLPLAAGTDLHRWSLQGLAARELIAAPHVWQLRASGQATAGGGQAFVRESLFVPVMAPAPSAAPQAALLLNGCVSAAPASAWQVCPLVTSGAACTGRSSAPAVYSHFVPDADSDGQLSATEHSACLALSPSQLPGGGTQLGPAQAVSRSPCNRAVWASVLGDITPAQLKAWSDAQAGNGLHALSQPARSIYWIDSPADWTQSLGSPQAPVLLVFSRLACASTCPRIAANVQIHGTVFVDAGCDDNKLQAWQAGTVDGLLAIEGGLGVTTGQSLIRAQAYARQAFTLYWPQGMDPGQVQRVPGSYRQGPP